MTSQLKKRFIFLFLALNFLLGCSAHDDPFAVGADSDDPFHPGDTSAGGNQYSSNGDPLGLVESLIVETCKTKCELSNTCPTYEDEPSVDCNDSCIPPSEGETEIVLDTDFCADYHDHMGYSTVERCAQAQHLDYKFVETIDDCLETANWHVELADLKNPDELMLEYENECNELHSESCATAQTDYILCLEAIDDCSVWIERIGKELNLQPCFDEDWDVYANCPGLRGGPFFGFR